MPQMRRDCRRCVETGRVCWTHWHGQLFTGVHGAHGQTATAKVVPDATFHSAYIRTAPEGGYGRNVSQERHLLSCETLRPAKIEELTTGTGTYHVWKILWPWPPPTV